MRPALRNAAVVLAAAAAALAMGTFGPLGASADEDSNCDSTAHSCQLPNLPAPPPAQEQPARPDAITPVPDDQAPAAAPSMPGRPAQAEKPTQADEPAPAKPAAPADDNCG